VLAPDARQEGAWGFRRLLGREAHIQRQPRRRLALQTGDRPVETEPLKHRRLARAGLRQQDQHGVLVQRRADVGQRHALDLALRPLAAHQDGAVGRRQLGHRTIAPRQRHVALLPLLKVRVHAQAQEILALALR
jgi:hypothetical protein